MRLLMPSVGRKTYLASRLREMLSGIDGALFGSDVDRSAPALRYVDGTIELPGFLGPGYWHAVDAAIDRHGITAVLPTRDAELEAWSRRAERGELQAEVLLSPSDTLAVCGDKALLYAAAADCNVRCPRWTPVTAQTDEAGLFFPSVVKPSRGSGSRGLYRVRSKTQWQEVARRLSAPCLLQVWHSGIEYSVDCFVDEAGRLVDWCVRERMQVVDGEATAGRVADDPDLVERCLRLASRMRFRGVINVQFIVDDDGAWLIDLNPRFPGGIAITEAAGHAFIRRTLELPGQLALARRHVDARPLPD
ncbi:MAG: ATP-grasp domain-containing protein [Gammaproteobacteria bacterium]|nr:ATP-grasp domain-containing protein [Gammaproteobacteria bacterium]